MSRVLLDFSLGPAHLGSENCQLVIRRDGEPDARVPFEEVAAVILGHRGVVITSGALASLASAGAPVVAVGSDFLPKSVTLPISSHWLVHLRAEAQLSCPLPRRKQLWAAVVRAKIAGQAAVLGDHSVAARLEELVGQVRSGDSSNREAVAARAYWSAWAEAKRFRRDLGAGDLANAGLNYGYTVLRAYVARAIAAAGLLPTLGVFHRHRANPFCLADDLIEPFRVLVDQRVRGWVGRPASLGPEEKAWVASACFDRVRHEGGSTSLAAALHPYVASFASALESGAAMFRIPEPVWPT